MTTSLILTIEIKCPTCGANPKERCRKNGPAYRHHAKRAEAAAKAMVAPKAEDTSAGGNWPAPDTETDAR